MLLHSKGRITSRPSFSEILGAQIMLLTWTSPLIAIAMQKSTSIAYPILWRRQIQLCLNTVRKVECHLSQESSPSSPWQATLGRIPKQATEAKPQTTKPASEHPNSTPSQPKRPSFFFCFFFPLFFFFSQLSRSEERCTGPFNWGEAHCAGEKETKDRTIPVEVSMNQTKQQNNQGARPATATRNPPARLPGARAKEENNHNKQETSQTNLDTP